MTQDCLTPTQQKNYIIFVPSGKAKPAKYVPPRTDAIFSNSSWVLVVLLACAVVLMGIKIFLRSMKMDLSVGNLVIEKRGAVGGGSLETWWEINQYERITPIGVYVNPTLIKKGTKTELKKLLEKSGLCIGEKISRDKYKVNLKMKEYIIDFEDGTTKWFQGDYTDALEYAESLFWKHGSYIID